MPGEIDLDFLVQVLELLDGRVPGYRAQEDPRVRLRIAIDRRAVVDPDLDLPAVTRMQVDMNARPVIFHDPASSPAPASSTARSARTPSPPPHSPGRSTSGARPGAWNGCRHRFPPRGRAGRCVPVVSYRPSCRCVLSRFPRSGEYVPDGLAPINQADQHPAVLAQLVELRRAHVEVRLQLPVLEMVAVGLIDRSEPI